MLVVDVESTGTNPQKHSLLSIGAVDFNIPSREFYMECQAFEGAHIDDGALQINGVSKDDVFNTSKKTEAEIVAEFLKWASETPDHTIAGQNPSFDTSFILAAAERAGLNTSIPKRTIDLHSVCYFHMIKNGIIPPLDTKHKRSDLDSDAIMKYVGIPPEVHPHIAINGARIEAEAFSRLFYEKSIYPEYKDLPIPWVI